MKKAIDGVNKRTNNSNYVRFRLMILSISTYCCQSNYPHPSFLTLDSIHFFFTEIAHLSIYLQQLLPHIEQLSVCEAFNRIWGRMSGKKKEGKGFIDKWFLSFIHFNAFVTIEFFHTAQLVHLSTSLIQFSIVTHTHSQLIS